MVCNSICVFLTKYPTVWAHCLNFRLITAKLSGIGKFRNFTLCTLSFIGTQSPQQAKKGVSGTMKATQLQASIESFTQYIKDHFGSKVKDLPEVSTTVKPVISDPLSGDIDIAIDR